jgi:hypothetical protein
MQISFEVIFPGMQQGIRVGEHITILPDLMATMSF